MSERFFHANGESFTYRRLSERVPVFLQRYPLEQGWSLKSEFQDPVSLHRGRLELLKTAIANGHNPESIGLGKLETDVLICRAALVRDEQEFVVRHAQGLVLENKDLERLESVAFQRILAATGFDGASLDADEDADMATQRIAPAAIRGQPKAEAQGVLPAQEPQPSQVFDLDAVRAMAQEPGSRSAAESESGRRDPDPAVSAEPEASTPNQAEVGLRAVSEDAPESVPPGDSSSEHEDGKSREPAAQNGADATHLTEDSVASVEGEGVDIPVALQRQLDNLARRLGESSPEPASLEEAKAAVLDMSRRLNPRGKKEAA